MHSNDLPNEKKVIRSIILDIGTGSGCLAIALALEYEHSTITATDISKPALDVAEKNSKKYNTCNQIQFICCDWINKIGVYDLIVSNPPYLSENEYNNTDKEIKIYEPKTAFLAGKDGLKCFRELAKILQKISHNNSLCIIEIGHDQKKECINIFREFGMDYIDIITDYQNYERILVLKKYSN